MKTTRDDDLADLEEMRARTGNPAKRAAITRVMDNIFRQTQNSDIERVREIYIMASKAGDAKRALAAKLWLFQHGQRV